MPLYAVFVLEPMLMSLILNEKIVKNRRPFPRLRDRQPKPEDRTLAGVAFHLGASVVKQGDVADDGEAEAPRAATPFW